MYSEDVIEIRECHGVGKKTKTLVLWKKNLCFYIEKCEVSIPKESRLIPIGYFPYGISLRALFFCR